MLKMTSTDRAAAITELTKKKAVDQVIYINSVRKNPALASTEDYQRKYNHYYRLRQQRPTFYAAYYSILRGVAAREVKLTLSTVIKQLFDECGAIHLSFCSKLMATASDEYIIYDSVVAKKAGLSPPSSPSKRTITEAVERYNDLLAQMKTFAATPAAEHCIIDFDQAFPAAAGFGKLRKLDLMLWACSPGK